MRTAKWLFYLFAAFAAMLLAVPFLWLCVGLDAATTEAFLEVIGLRLREAYRKDMQR